MTALPAPPPRLLAIASGKGGVGKTFLAITLAHALAREERGRVLLVDGDLGLANVDIQLGLLPEQDLGAVLLGAARFADVVVPAGEAGFDVLPGRSGSGALAAFAGAQARAAIARLRREAASYAHVLLDIGAGVDEAARALAAAADTLLLVITEDPTSLTDAYAVIKLLLADRKGEKPDIRVIVNMAGTVASGLRAHETLARAAEGFLACRPALAGVVRRDERVREAIRRQTPLLSRAPQSVAGADIVHIAARLAPVPA